MSPTQVYGLAIAANLAFSSSSLIFSIYARRFSSWWINQVKVSVAFVAFVIALFSSNQMVSISPTAFALLFMSGLIALCLGDLFLFRAFSTLGAGRTLVIFSFQPLMLGVYGHFFLRQYFTLNQTLSVVCMIICVFIFMLERNKSTGSWDVKSFIWAFVGITLDSMGVMMTRTSFELTPDLQTFQVNVIRCLGALTGLFLLRPKGFLKIAQDLKILSRKELGMLFTACFGGTFLSLTLYLTALKYAHVGTLTSIAITGPVWVSLLECFYYKKMPHPFLWAAFSFFFLGFYLMVTA